MDGGQLDLKGLITTCAGYGLGKLNDKTGLDIDTADVLTLVPQLMTELGLPEILDIGLAGMALGRITLAGYKRQQAINNAHRKQKDADT